MTAEGRVVHVRGAIPYDLYVGRISPRYGLDHSVLSNPFALKDYGNDRRRVLGLYEERMKGLIAQCLAYEEETGEPTILLDLLRSLTPLTLACWCAPKDRVLTATDPEICHAQVIHRLARTIPSGAAA